MAYPALLTAPFAYSMNFHAEETRGHKNVSNVRFMADSATDAVAISDIFKGILVSQQTSMSQRVGSHLATDAAYPTGTRLTVKATTIDAEGGVSRSTARNYSTAVAAGGEGFAALLLGVAPVDNSPAIAALSAAPQNPATGAAIVTANVTLITKPY
jgi:hypothetical protein